jgi:hypothetical protein
VRYTIRQTGEAGARFRCCDTPRSRPDEFKPITAGFEEPTNFTLNCAIHGVYPELLTNPPASTKKRSACDAAVHPLCAASIGYSGIKGFDGRTGSRSSYSLPLKKRGISRAFSVGSPYCA